MIYNLPRKKKKGETWYLNETISRWYTNTTIPFFYCNNEVYNKFEYTTNTSYNEIYYVNTETSNKLRKVYLTKGDESSPSKIGFQNEIYRILFFIEPPTGDLLTWLQANATKQ